MSRPAPHDGIDMEYEKRREGRVHRHVVWTHEPDWASDRWNHVIWSANASRRLVRRAFFWWTWTVILRRDHERVRAAGIEGTIWRWRYAIGRFER